jgi:hypothetical protein
MEFGSEPNQICYFRVCGSGLGGPRRQCVGDASGAIAVSSTTGGTHCSGRAMGLRPVPLLVEVGWLLSARLVWFRRERLGLASSSSVGLALTRYPRKRSRRRLLSDGGFCSIEHMRRQSADMLGTSSGPQASTVLPASWVFYRDHKLDLLSEPLISRPGPVQEIMNHNGALAGNCGTNK